MYIILYLRIFSGQVVHIVEYIEVHYNFNHKLSKNYVDNNFCKINKNNLCSGILLGLVKYTFILYLDYMFESINDYNHNIIISIQIF